MQVIVGYATVTCILITPAGPGRAEIPPTGGCRNDRGLRLCHINYGMPVIIVRP